MSDVLVAFWLRFGNILVTFWLHFCYVLVTSWLHFSYILVTFWLRFGYILVTLWLHFDYVFVTFWLHFGYNQIVTNLCRASPTVPNVLFRILLTTKWYVRLINPSICDALLMMKAWWSFQVRLSFTITPKSFSWDS